MATKSHPLLASTALTQELHPGQSHPKVSTYLNLGGQEAASTVEDAAIDMFIEIIRTKNFLSGSAHELDWSGITARTGGRLVSSGVYQVWLISIL